MAGRGPRHAGGAAAGPSAPVVHDSSNHHHHNAAPHGQQGQARPRPIDASVDQWIEKVETNGIVQGIRVHVFTSQQEERALTFENVDVTAGQVCEAMAEEEGIKPESGDLFSLWIVGHELELQYRKNQDIFDLIDKFPRFVEKYTHVRPTVISYRFYYRREALVSVARDRKVKDAAAIRLLYYEAAYNVQSGRYPIQSEQDAFTLGGLRMQLLYGDHKPEVHTTGFLTVEDDCVLRLETVLPLSFLDPAPTLGNVLRPPRHREWEASILAEHAKHKGKPRMIIQLLYLQLVRSWTFYGSTFFSACFSHPPRGFFEYRDEFLHVGVNADGIYVVDRKRSRVLSSFMYDDVNWDVRQNLLLIEHGPLNAPLVTTLISPQAKMAASIISRAIKNLDDSDRRLAQQRLEQRAAGL